MWKLFLVNTLHTHVFILTEIKKSQYHKEETVIDIHDCNIIFIYIVCMPITQPSHICIHIITPPAPDTDAPDTFILPYVTFCRPLMRGIN